MGSGWVADHEGHWKLFRLDRADSAAGLLVLHVNPDSSATLPDADTLLTILREYLTTVEVWWRGPKSKWIALQPERLEKLPSVNGLVLPYRLAQTWLPEVLPALGSATGGSAAVVPATVAPANDSTKERPALPPQGSAAAPLSDSERAILSVRADQFFEALRREGNVPDFEPFLTGLPGPTRVAVLNELVIIDLLHRWERGERPIVENYIQRYPELGPIDQVPATLIYEEYRCRVKAGQTIDLSEYKRRFPKQYPTLLVQTGTKETVNPGGAHRTGGSDTNTNRSNDAVVAGPQKYELLSKLGAGNFGEVWLAQNHSGIKKAIKILSRPIDHGDVKRELKSLEHIKNLRHPYLLATEDFWIASNRLYIVMELADCTLRGRLKQCKEEGLPGVPDDELFGYFLEAAEGLDYLHTQNITHRDVKPDNILVANGHAKVADFGLARKAGAMQSMSFAGTPAYMAPEMWGGEGGPPSDLYGLVFAYTELRQGRPPLQFDSPYNAMFAHLDGQFDFADFITEAEREVLRKGMARMTTDRYPTCMAFIEALSAALGRPVVIKKSGRVAMPASRTIQTPSARSSGETAPDTVSREPSGTVRTDAQQRKSSSPRPISASKPDPWQPRKKHGSKRGLFAALVATSVLLGAIGFVIWMVILSPGPTQPTGETTSTDRGGGGGTNTVADNWPIGNGIGGIGSHVSDLKGSGGGSGEPTARDYDMWLKRARDYFAQAANTPDSLKLGLDVLHKLLGPNSPPNVKDTTNALLMAWTQAETDSANKTPNRSDRVRFASLSTATAPAPLDDGTDGLALRAFYKRLNNDYPIPDITAARKHFQTDELDKAIDKLKPYETFPAGDADRTAAVILKNQWREADNLNQKFTGKSVTLVDLKAACAKAALTRRPDDVVEADYMDLRVFYARRLPVWFQHFAMLSEPGKEWSDTKSWAELEKSLELLPPMLRGISWVALVHVECGLIRRHLGDNLSGLAIAELPALPAKPQPDLEAYQNLLAALRQWDITLSSDKAAKAANDVLSATVALEKSVVPVTATRKRLAGSALLNLSIATRPKSAGMDAPFGADPTGARKWLEKAMSLLDDKDGQRNKTRALLLMAAAFPTPDAARIKVALDKDRPDMLAAALDGAERPGFWLAYAHTRDLQGGGVVEAINGFEKAFPALAARPDRSALRSRALLVQQYLLQNESLRTAAEGQPAARNAAAKLYTRVACELFRYRPLSPPDGNLPANEPLTVATELAARAATFTKSPNDQALAGLFRLVASPKLAPDILADHEKTAKQLFQNAQGAAIPLAYLGSVQFRVAALEYDLGKRLAQLTSADQYLRKALEAIKATQSETDLSILPQLLGYLANTNTYLANDIALRDPTLIDVRLKEVDKYSGELLKITPDDPWALYVRGCLFEDRAWLPGVWHLPVAPEVRQQFYKQADQVLSKATIGDGEESIRKLAQLHLGRCRLKWAMDFPDDQLARVNRNAAANHLATVPKGSSGRAEAVYWLAQLRLFEARITRPVQWRTPINKWPKVDVPSLDEARQYLDELVALPADPQNRIWRTFAVNWLACLECDRAIRSAEESDFKKAQTDTNTALGALKKLTDYDNMKGRLLQSQFLDRQIHTAVQAPTTDNAWIMYLWKEFQKSIPDQGSGNNDQDDLYLVELAGIHYRMRAIDCSVIGLPAAIDDRAVQRCLATLRTIAGRGDVFRKQVVYATEDAGLKVAVEFGKSKHQEKVAALAIQAFQLTGELDPHMTLTAGRNRADAIRSVQWREFLVQFFKMVPKSDQDATDPDKQNQLIENLHRAYDLSMQSVRMCRLLNAPELNDQSANAANRIRVIRGFNDWLSLEDPNYGWLDMKLPQAIKLYEAKEPKKVEAWWAWQKKAIEYLAATDLLAARDWQGRLRNRFAETYKDDETNNMNWKKRVDELMPQSGS